MPTDLRNHCVRKKWNGQKLQEAITRIQNKHLRVSSWMPQERHHKAITKNPLLQPVRASAWVLSMLLADAHCMCCTRPPTAYAVTHSASNPDHTVCDLPTQPLTRPSLPPTHTHQSRHERRTGARPRCISTILQYRTASSVLTVISTGLH